ncbi:hypothetical protein AB0O76_34180 [Streptomyces sp. NPDC086554]|uniref:hypothetical protein n=1 Tax=Streptomyces sp. NPDC086554 TaxID=3154864 RepID=UPI00342FDD53
MKRSWVDAGFKNAVIEHGRALGIAVELISRDPQTKEFAPSPKRWIAEQTFGTLMLHCRLTRDYETLPASSASWIRCLHAVIPQIQPRRNDRAGRPRPALAAVRRSDLHGLAAPQGPVLSL